MGSQGFSNSTAALFASDMLLAFPRLAQRAGVFALNHLPDQLDGIFAIPRYPRSFIADATSKVFTSNVSTAPSGTTSLLTPSPTSALSSKGYLPFGSFLMPEMGRVDGFFSYIASKWALTTIIMAIVLNRAHVYSLPRRPLSLTWKARLFLRTAPIVLFIYQIVRILETTRCQTGSYVLQENAGISRAFIPDGKENYAPFLQWLSSTVLFWQSEVDSCHAAGMIIPAGSPAKPAGSASLLWPLFLCFCLGHFLETVSCSVTGRTPLAETGMTLFETSLAFAEAEAGIRTSFGLGMFGLPSAATTTIATRMASPTESIESSAAIPTIMRSIIMHRANAPPEVLTIMLLASCNHLASHILGLLGRQQRYRLVNTTIWGLSYMILYLRSFINAIRFVSGETTASFPRLPIVCVIGFVPHLMIVASITGCILVYCLTFIITLIAGVGNSAGMTFKQRCSLAYQNLQANAFLANIRLTWQDEFYTFLLRTGWAMMTAASEAVYFNEVTPVTVSKETWLDERHARELSRRRQRANHFRARIPSGLQSSFETSGRFGLIDQDDPGESTSSGYGRERQISKGNGKIVAAAASDEGVGGSQRTARIFLSYNLLKDGYKLLISCWARITLVILRTIGITRTPAFLLVMCDTPKQSPSIDKQKQQSVPAQQRLMDFWMLSDDGNLRLPTDVNVDVEQETRKRMSNSDERHDRSEEALDVNLYSWWKHGGWWGEVDSSGEYQPQRQEFDTTSVLSDSTTDEPDEPDEHDEPDEWEDEEDQEEGQRTPTQGSFGNVSRESTPFEHGTFSDLSRLLAPKTTDDKIEALLLGHRLGRKGPLTRSQYSRELLKEKMQSEGRDSQRGNSASSSSAAEVETSLLEQIIVSRRYPLQAALSPGAGLGRTSSAKSTSWTDGGQGMGSEGPQCVVCHSSPRTVLVWPCRCLSLCEDCRVTLAMNNFGTCVCCRRDVVAFSRLYVP